MTPQPPADALINKARRCVDGGPKWLTAYPDRIIPLVRSLVNALAREREEIIRLNKVADRLVIACDVKDEELAREQEARKEAEARWQEAEHPFDASEFKALLQRAERSEAQVEALRTYVIYTPCPVCGLPDPLRRGANCEQCAKASEALASLPPPQEEE